MKPSLQRKVSFSSPQQIKPVQALPMMETFNPKAEGENTSLSSTSSMGCLDRNSSCSQVPAGKVTTISAQKVKPKEGSNPLDGEKAISGILSDPLPSHLPELLRELIQRTSGSL